MKVLTKKGFDKKNIVSYGNMFLLANGRFGYRGTLEEYRKDEMTSLNILGLYDKYQDKWRESVNLPNPFYVLVKGEKEYSVLTNNPLEHEVKLDIENGLFTRKTIYEDLIIESSRFVSSCDKNVLACHYVIKAKKEIDLNVQFGLDLDIYEINGPHFKKKDCYIGWNFVEFKGITNEEKEISTNTKCVSNKGLVHSFSENNIFGYVLDISLDKDETVELEIISEINGIDSINKSFNELYLAHKKAFNKLWENAYIELLGDKEANFELQYSIYHLLILEDNLSFKSVPARGLSGETYKGAIFWDTEMFMMPFYAFTNPRFARNTLVYRINTLEGAKKKAAKYGYKGAFYAWESQDDGTEQCSDYNVTDPETNEPIRTYFADKQIHISGDIALAISRYVCLTDDETILEEGGYEVIYETIKFYDSYLTKKSNYHIFDVMGPDEYHERVNDNAYTNMLLENVLHIAIHHYDKYIHTVKEQTLSRDDMKAILSHLYIPKPNKEGIIEQFSGYFALEDVLPNEVKKRKKCDKEYMGGEKGVAGKTRVIKQADVLSGLIFLDHPYDLEILKKNYEFYYPYTEHGSSLSASVYSLAAAKINKLDDAYYLFRKSSGIDLGVDQKMFAGGIYIGGTHPASNAGAYLSVLLGFVGLWINKEGFTITPNLPPSIEGIRCKFIHKGKQYLVNVKKDNSYTLEEVK